MPPPHVRRPTSRPLEPTPDRCSAPRSLLGLVSSARPPIAAAARQPAPAGTAASAPWPPRRPGPRARRPGSALGHRPPPRPARPPDPRARRSTRTASGERSSTRRVKPTVSGRTDAVSTSRTSAGASPKRASASAPLTAVGMTSLKPRLSAAATTCAATASAGKPGPIAPDLPFSYKREPRADADVIWRSCPSTAAWFRRHPTADRWPLCVPSRERRTFSTCAPCGPRGRRGYV